MKRWLQIDERYRLVSIWVFYTFHGIIDVCVCVRLCVYARARARVCVCMCQTHSRCIVIHFILFVVYLTAIFSDYIASNKMIVSERWSGKNMERVLLCHLPGGNEENHENPHRSPGWDLNPEPPEYKVGVLTTQPRRSCYILIFVSLSRDYSISCL
jgi:hypothetical protein